MVNNSLSLPKITFGIIVLNGEPFVKYNLRSIYPYAHQIVVIEGAVKSAFRISDINGHSSDDTLESLMTFKKEEDINNKLIIVTAEDEGHSNGFWLEKDEMSHAYAKRATGDYIWQIDIDEFYMPDDIEYICNMLIKRPNINVIAFPMLTFWGSQNYLVDGFYLRIFKAYRIFKWSNNYNYVRHRPPTIMDENGLDIRKKGRFIYSELLKKKIFLYHYELLFPKQALEKSIYYSNAIWSTNKFDRIDAWYEFSYLKLKKKYHPHMVYHYLSWLFLYKGNHPPQIKLMIQNILSEKIKNIQLRNNGDVEELLNSKIYKLNCFILSTISELIKILYPVFRKFKK